MPRLKLKEISSNVLRSDIKIKVPDDILESMKSYSKPRSTMWLCGMIMGSFMLSPQGPDESKRKLVMLPKGVKPSVLLECDVVKINKS